MAQVELSTPAAGVMLITLNRPGRLNALTAPVVAEFSAALDSVAADDRCRIVVLTGAGRAFSAGLDLGGYGDDERAAGSGRRARHADAAARDCPASREIALLAAAGDCGGQRTGRRRWARLRVR